MKLRNLLHIQKDHIHLIGSLNPLFFYRLSDITSEFIRNCALVSYENAIDTIKTKYDPKEFEEFKMRLEKIKDKLFISSEDQPYKRIDLSQRVTTLTFNLTRKCNLKCSYCFENEEYRKMGNMPFEVAKKAIDVFFTDNSTKWVIIFTGGEPVLNYNLIKEIVKYVSNLGLLVEYRIKTNATLLNEEKMNFLIENKFKIQISLDGNEKAHDTHRKFANGKGSFKIVDRALRVLIDRNYSHMVTISATTTRQTVDFINDSFANLNFYKGIRYDLKPVMPNSNVHFVLDKAAYYTAFHSIARNTYQLQLKHKQMIDEKMHICGIGVWNIAIDVDGKIYPCYRMCGDSKYIIGTLDSLIVPFNLPKELINIYQLENNKRCAECFFLTSCKKGCYTDKLMCKQDANKCFSPTIKVITSMLQDDFITNESYKLLDVI